MTVPVMNFPERTTMSEVEYRVQPCVAGETDGWPWVQSLADDQDYFADFFTVYEVQLDGTSQAIGDFKCRRHAQALVDRLNSSTIRSSIFAA